MRLKAEDEEAAGEFSSHRWIGMSGRGSAPQSAQREQQELKTLPCQVAPLHIRAIEPSGDATGLTGEGV